MPVTEIVLVVGIDYPKYNGEQRSRSTWRLLHPEPTSTQRDPWNWRTCALRIREDALRRFADQKLIVTLFDFARGTVESWRYDRGHARGNAVISRELPYWANYRVFDEDAQLLQPLRREWPRTGRYNDSPPSVFYFPGVSELGEEPVTVNDYLGEWAQAERGEPSSLVDASMSILDIYKYLAVLGSPRESAWRTLVRELHVFSHAFVEGPILYNTVDLRKQFKLRGYRRDPLDRDARATKDFNSDNMPSKVKAGMQAAFAPDGHIFLWGCNQSPFWKEFILETVRKDEDGARRLSEYEFAHRGRERCWGYGNEWFSRLFAGASTVKKSLREIVDFVKLGIQTSYAQELANAIRCTVIGTLPGTASVHDSVSPSYGKPLHLLWHVPMGRRTGDIEGGDDACLHPADLTRVLQFYQRELNYAFDNHFTSETRAFKPPLGRGYAIITPTQN